MKALASTWLEWFRERHSAPHVIRLDFLVTGKGEVYTCELTECGGATCGLEVAPRSVAVVNSAMGDPEGFPEGFPKELPKFEVEKDTRRRKEAKSEAKSTKSLELPRKKRWELALGILAVLAFLWPKLRSHLPYIKHVLRRMLGGAPKS